MTFLNVKTWILICFFGMDFRNVNALRTKDKMFSTISGANCFRRLNASHTTGCSSNLFGSSGVLHLIKTTENFNFIKNNPPSPPYALVIPPHLFTRQNILPIKENKYVSAIVLINSTTELINFSQELKCPNINYGLVNEQCDSTKLETTWNPFGTGLLHENFPFPILFLSDQHEIQKILDCFDRFNNFDLTGQAQRSLCSIEINAFMSAAVNSRVCIKRTQFTNSLSVMRFCDPLAGHNVFATLFPREIVKLNDRSVQSNEKFILVSTRIDTTSMFDGMGPGAMDSLVSYTVLMSIANMLSKLIPERIHANTSNILFIFFNGESYDYIGSQRFVYDLSKKEFPPSSQYTNPISWENIEFMIDIGVLDDLESIKLYHASEFKLASNLEFILSRHNLTVNSILTRNLPPASAQTFLRNNITFPAVILYSTPTNHYYHSVYDGIANINYTYYNTSLDFTELVDGNEKFPFLANSIQLKIQKVATALSLSLLELLNGAKYDNISLANPILIDELLFCFLISADCPLLNAASPSNSLSNLPIPMLRYISVTGSYTHQSTGWTSRILGFLLGKKVQKSKDNCSYLPFYWYVGFNSTGECHRTTQNLSIAVSPAFINDDYDWNSGNYSTWTESTWKELNARIFLKPSATHEAFNLAIGFIVMLFSFVIIFLINSRSDVLFGDNLSTISDVSTPTHC